MHLVSELASTKSASTHNYKRADVVINSCQRVEEFMKLLDGLLERDFWLPNETLVDVLDSNFGGGNTVIGFGATGDVVALWFTPSSKIVAKKSLEVLAESPSFAINELRAHLLARGCSNLLQIVGAQLIEDLSRAPPPSLRLNIICEFAALGDLFSFIPLLQHVLKIYQIPEEFLLKLSAHLLKAVSQLHSLDLVHRDVKPENFLLFVDDDDLVQTKLSDFGLCISAEELRHCDKRMVNVCGTASCASPEQFWVGPHKVSSASDVYSLGVLMCKLLAHAEDRFIQRQIHQSRLETIRTTFSTEMASVLIGQLIRQESVPYRYRRSTKLGALLKRMLREEPTKRPTANKAYEQLVALLPRNSATISLDEFIGQMTALSEAASPQDQAGHRFALSMMEKFRMGLRLRSNPPRISC